LFSLSNFTVGSSADEMSPAIVGFYETGPAEGYMYETKIANQKRNGS